MQDVANIQDGVKKEGYLLKRGRVKFSKYRRCWFELDEVSEEVLIYTDNPQLGPGKSKLVGNVSMDGAEITSRNSKDKFKLLIKTKKGNKVSLMAKDEQEQKDWSDALIRTKNFAKNAKQLVEDLKNNTGDDLKHGLSDFENEFTKINETATDLTEDEETEAEEDNADFYKELLESVVEDMEGNKVTLKEVVAGQVTLLLFLRHFGCMLCRQACGELAAFKERLEELGVRIVAIGNGTPAMAKNFKSEFNFPGKLYVDQLRKIYKLLNLRRDFKSALGLRSLAAAANAIKKGYRQGQTQGDLLQLGGLFIYSEKNGFIYQHASKYAGDYANYEDIVLAMEKYALNNAEDMWSMHSELALWRKLHANNYGKPVRDSNIALESLDKGFVYELSNNTQGLSSESMKLIEKHLLFRSFMAAREYQLFGYSGDEEEKNAFLIAITKLPTNEHKALVFNTRDTVPIVVPYYIDNEKELLKYITTKVLGKEFSGIKKLDVDMNDALLDYESKSFFKKYKFGLLYVQAGQIEENDYYSNDVISADLQEFMDLLGQTVDIKSWNKYIAGLPTEGDCKGVYAEIEDTEIMFHAAPLIPARVEDPQRIDRKRHLGNDVVMLIFKEGDQKFDPSIFNSQFNHIFVVVQKLKHAGPGVRYRVECIHKQSVPPHPPSLPAPAVFGNTPEFRRWLLLKLINSERAALRETPAFRNKMCVPRLSMIKELIEKALAMRKTSSPPLSPTGDGAISRSSSRKSVLPSPRASRQMQITESGNIVVPNGYVPLETIEPSPATDFSFDKLELKLSTLSVKVDDESSSSDSLSRSYVSDPRLAVSGSKSARSDQPIRSNTEFTFKQVKPSYTSGKSARSMTVDEGKPSAKSPRASTEVSKDLLRQRELQSLAREPLGFDLTNVTDIAVLDDAIRKITARKEKIMKLNEGK
jgi:hypothetical protein